MNNSPIDNESISISLIKYRQKNSGQPLEDNAWLRNTILLDLIVI